MLLTRFLPVLVAGLLWAGDSAYAQSCAPKVTADHLIAAGQWQLSINPTLPPQQFVDKNGDLQGLNVDLARALAAKLCLSPVFLRMDFPAMIPALRAGRFDTIDTGMFWTQERAKLFYLVPYAQQALSVYTLVDSPLKITTFDDLSGHVVGVETATNNERKARERNAELVARGLKPIDLRSFTTASETTAALRAGQLDAAINIDETANDLVQRNVVKVWLHGLFGTDITFAFRDRTLAVAMVEALNALKADGTYDKLFDRFGMTRLAGDTFAIRGSGPE
jgi:polar amino acid transport system substrate-binding protein